MIDSLDPARREISSAIDSIDPQLLSVPVPQEATPNQDIVDLCRNWATQLSTSRATAKKQMLSDLDSIETNIRNAADDWKKRYQKHDLEYRQLQIEKGATRMLEINNQLEIHRQTQFGLQRRLQGIQAAEKALNGLLQKRRALLDTIQDRKSRIQYLRERKAKDCVKEVGNIISLKLIPDGNRDNYLNLMIQIMKGTHASKGVLERVCRSIHPRELADLLRAQNANEIDSRSQIGEKWAQSLIDQVKATPEYFYRIQSIPVEDLLEISLRVGEKEYRPIDKLSTGQKATVIVLLTMVEGKQPIIFDQPEDALYTPFIYTDVVKTLRKEKDLRQFIFATHNSNIAVAGDTDLGIVVEGTSTNTSIQVAGGLDDNKTQELMLLHLEGGPDAFRVRQTKFKQLLTNG